MAVSHFVTGVWATNYFGENYFGLMMFCWIVGGAHTASAGLAMHEVAHSLVFTGFWPTLFAGYIAESPLFLPAYLSFKHYHMPHHSYITISIDSVTSEK